MEQLYQAIKRLTTEYETAIAQDQKTTAIRLVETIHDRLLIYKRTSREVSLSHESDGQLIVLQTSSKQKYVKHLDAFDSAGVRFWNKSTLLRAGNGEAKDSEVLCLIAARESLEAMC